MTTQPNQEQEILAEAMEIASSPKRRTFVERACGDDSAMKDRVNARLARQASTADLPPDRSHAEGPGRVIDRYKLLEKIGEGGNGEVWAAEQRRPVKRRVALKIIKLGMDTK